MAYVSLKQQGRRQAQALFDDLPAAKPELIMEEQVQHLPDPVQRFMHYTQAVGMLRTRTVRRKQMDLFRIDEKPMPNGIR
jgi:hypothetical protein